MLLKKITVFVIFFTMSGTSIAQAEPYLNNGHISFNNPSADTQNFLDYYTWGETSLYRTPYDEDTAISLTNSSGWGITITKNDFCYTTDRYDECAGKETGVTETSATIDYSGVSSFTQDGKTYTYGTITTSHQISLGGQNVLLANTIKLNRDQTYGLITTTLENKGPASSDFRVLINNFDGMVYSDGLYRSTRGNVIGGEFVLLTSTEQSSNAVVADAQGYGHNGENYAAILLAGPSSGSTTSNLSRGCCSPEDLAYETSAALTQINTDGSYAVIKSLPTLGTNETFTFRWVFGGNTYTSLTSSTFLTEVLLAIAAEAPAAPKPVPVYVRQSTNLSFSKSLYGTDTLSDPDGQLRKTIDAIDANYGYLIQ